LSESRAGLADKGYTVDKGQGVNSRGHYSARLIKSGIDWTAGMPASFFHFHLFGMKWKMKKCKMKNGRALTWGDLSTSR
jgi:hypothetical protein